MEYNSGLKPFDFSPEIMARIKETLQIPVNFYNAQGQVLIQRKDEASAQTIEKLLQHVGSGIFYREEDEEKLRPRKQTSEVEGLTDTNLIDGERVARLSEFTDNLFNELKFATFTSVHSQKMHQQVNSFIEDFEKQPDVMVGLVNILDSMKGIGGTEMTKQAIKRAVVSMALKTRSMKAMISKDRGRGTEAVIPVMMSSMLAQVGKSKMTITDSEKLTTEQRAYLRKFPLLSYLMVAHEPNVSFEVKRLILNQKRTLPDNETANNYPDMKWLLPTLSNLATENLKKGKKDLVEDIHRQIRAFKEFALYEEDVNIVSLASDFAALTTETSWREAFDPDTAIKMIINASYFQYGGKVIRDFLDHISLSLSHNRKVINKTDLLIVSLNMQSGKSYFEVCKVIDVGRFQSRPIVERIGMIDMMTTITDGMVHGVFLPETFKADPRKIKINLGQDHLRRIIYILNNKLNPELSGKLQEKLSRPS